MARQRSGPKSPSLRLALLGGFAARDGAGRDIAIGGRKAQALLAYLALSPGKPQPREKLASLLWSDRSEAQARASLRQALSELRRAVPQSESPFLKAERDSVWLDPGAVEADAVALERLVNSGEPEDLARAAELYEGEFLDGLDVRDAAFEEWRRGERERLRERTRQALTRLFEQQTGEQAIATGRRLLALDPLNEATHRGLMRLYADTGDRTLALRQYQSCRQVLNAELGVEPDAATRRLAEKIRKAETGDGQSEKTPPPAEALGPESGPSLASVKPSIAVLPFVNMSDDPEQQYFSDGITEDVTTELSRFGSINVLARHSTFVLRDRSENLREAVAALGADYLLEGSIRRAGNRIRLTAQLVDVGDRTNVWAHRYDRELADVFAIQDELVHAIVATLAGRLEASSLERALRKPPESLAAYDYYLRGLWYDRKYDSEYAAAERAALETAIALDPTLARAYGLLATSMMMTAWFEGSLEAASEKILRIARKAVELDPTDGDCFAKLAMIHIDRREHEDARRSLEKALDLNPHEPSIWSNYAWYHVTVGEPEKALECLDRREAIDPYPPNWHADVRAEAFYDLGRYEEATRILEQKAAPYHYNYGQLAACFGQLGRKEEAAGFWRKFIDGNPGATLSSVGEGNCYLLKADRDHWLEGLLKAGLSD